MLVKRVRHNSSNRKLPITITTVHHLSLSLIHSFFFYFLISRNFRQVLKAYDSSVIDNFKKLEKDGHLITISKNIIKELFFPINHFVSNHKVTTINNNNEQQRHE